MTLPDGYVDPADAVRVAAIVRGLADVGGAAAVLDLLARIPGVRVDPARPQRFLRAATPRSVWVGPENRFVESAGGVDHEHVVGGVTLARGVVGLDLLPSLVARVIGEHVARTGGVDEAAAALTAQAEVLGLT